MIPTQKNMNQPIDSSARERLIHLQQQLYPQQQQQHLVESSQTSCSSCNKPKSSSNSRNNGGVIHPLIPIQQEELEETVQIIHQHKSEFVEEVEYDHVKLVIVSVDNVEPADPQVKLACFQANCSALKYDRLSRTCLMVQNLQKMTSRTVEVVVSLTEKRLLEWNYLPIGTQPLVTLEEFAMVEKIVKGDVNFQNVMKRRGLVPKEIEHDTNLIQEYADRRWMIEPWSAGFYGEENEKGKRLLRTIVFTRLGSDDDNGYAHPVDGLSLTLDLVAKSVVGIDDLFKNADKPPHIPQERRNYEQDLFEKESGQKMRTDMKPIEITQPLGHSFTVTDSNLVTWQNWTFRVGFNALEGLTLHCLEFHKRPVVFRMSVAEMAVPYGDPTYVHSRKNAFDIGEYGLGKLANSLQLGCDCLGSIYYFDAVLCTMHGRPYNMKNVVCLHEEDNSMLWKHSDWRRNKVSVRRGRRLVISMIATVGNYEYGFYYYLYLDGGIELEVKHSGIINTSTTETRHIIPDQDGTGETEVPDYDSLKYATLVSKEGLVAQIHQHTYCCRMDMCVDGINNRLVEVNVHPEENESINFRQTAFYAKETLLSTEKEARRDMNLGTARFWKVVNNNKMNKTDHPVSYALVPAGNTVSFAKDSSWLIKRAPWLKHHLWATKYDPIDPRHPSGNHVNQTDGTTGGDTLEAVSDKNRSIVDDNLVLWYTFGITHVVRLEDFPVMPVTPLKAFTLVPHGFFHENPVMDVPPLPPKSQ